MNDKKETAIRLLDEVLSNLENNNVPLVNSIQKLNRVGKLINEKNLIIWTEVQLGNVTYTTLLTKLVSAYAEKEKLKTKEAEDKFKEIGEALRSLGCVDIISNDELAVKGRISGGGFQSIGFIEQRYNDILKRKSGNDGTYYQANLSKTVTVIRTLAFKKAAFYHKKYAYEGLPESSFDIMKKSVDDKLLDLDPELAEQLMLAFKRVSSENKEEWSQALASCRRFLEKLADNLFPATQEKVGGRSLTKENYINRLWAFLDDSIKSDSDKDVAKKHIDFLGSYLQSVYRVVNKGIHSDLSRTEALKVVMHIYLVCVDILHSVKKEKVETRKITVYTASLDELEAIGGISRKIAKEIIKLRVETDVITKQKLSKISGLGEKTLGKFLENVSLETN